MRESNQQNKNHNEEHDPKFRQLHEICFGLNVYVEAPTPACAQVSLQI